MASPRFFFIALLLLLVTFIQGAQAYSKKPPPVDRITWIENLEYSPAENITASSSLEATFDLHKEDYHIRLDLEPNSKILSRFVTSQQIDANGDVITERIEPSKYLVFKGNASIFDMKSETWRQAGWARITVLNKKKHNLFYGAFSIDKDVHHVTVDCWYRKKRRSTFPNVPRRETPYMIVWRDSDISPPHGGELKRRDSSAPADCEFDKATVNQGLIAA